VLASGFFGLANPSRARVLLALLPLPATGARPASPSSAAPASSLSRRKNWRSCWRSATVRQRRRAGGDREGAARAPAQSGGIGRPAHGRARRHCRSLAQESAERRRAEVALGLAHAELEQIFETAADGCGFSNATARFARSMPPRASSRTASSEIVGRVCHEVSPAAIVRLELSLVRIVGGETKVESEVRRGDWEDLVISTPFRAKEGAYRASCRRFTISPSASASARARAGQGGSGSGDRSRASSCQHEPRDPHADEWCHRMVGLLLDTSLPTTSASSPRPFAAVENPAGVAQRHSRLFQDRGGKLSLEILDFDLQALFADFGRMMSVRVAQRNSSSSARWLRISPCCCAEIRVVCDRCWST